MNPILLFRSNVCRRNGKSIPLLLFLVGLSFASLGFSSCRTAQGFGQDVEHAGEKIEDAARR